MLNGTFYLAPAFVLFITVGPKQHYVLVSSPYLFYQAEVLVFISQDILFKDIFHGCLLCTDINLFLFFPAGKQDEHA